jgi:hypothetical protein
MESRSFDLVKVEANVYERSAIVRDSNTWGWRVLSVDTVKERRHSERVATL